ncbi:hypothetical protein C8R45DRAFT_947661 [Mycena sanguinolenta]|nr:hypothetical protein C8R45DRAFT_948351 [Mycena sanguinolenta]KAJ6449016.1 hypothetical protein C8R45DRAFT_947661 [Mycena sanguinolenta]
MAFWWKETSNQQEDFTVIGTQWDTLRHSTSKIANRRKQTPAISLRQTTLSSSCSSWSYTTTSVVSATAAIAGAVRVMCSVSISVEEGEAGAVEEEMGETRQDKTAKEKGSSSDFVFRVHESEIKSSRMNETPKPPDKIKKRGKEKATHINAPTPTSHALSKSASAIACRVRDHNSTLVFVTACVYVREAGERKEAIVFFVSNVLHVLRFPLITNGHTVVLFVPSLVAPGLPPQSGPPPSSDQAIIHDLLLCIIESDGKGRAHRHSKPGTQDPTLLTMCWNSEQQDGAWMWVPLLA